ncbi:hypothetical protein E4U58_006445 [Claviceps cyperi]|nr:hypothetical protein E4U58_006445 [Claviceps cyperi]
MLGRHCVRSFSTSRKINPSFLSQLRQSRHGPLRWLRVSVLLCTSAAVVNICAKKFWDRQSLKNVTAEKDRVEKRLRNNALLDAYGDRSSLEELEKATQWYEKRDS